MSDPETRRHQGAVVAALTGAWEALTESRPDRTLPADVRLDGRTVLVTGANRGLGRAIAEGLARRGASLVVACRSMLDETVAALSSVPGAGAVRGEGVDLAALASVDALVERLAADGVVVDRLVLNAGMLPGASRETGDGFDVMFQVNFLANVRLVDRMLAAGVLPERPGDPPRVVVVGSEAHRSAKPIDLDHLGAGWSYGLGDVVSFYGLSKLHSHTWAAELARRVDGDPRRAEVVHLCPGAIASDIGREAPGWIQPVLKAFMRWTFPSPAQAAVSVIWAVAAPELDGRTGVYLHLGVEKAPSAFVQDPDNGRRLWEGAHALLDGAAP